MFEGKIDLEGKLAETIMSFKDIEAFQNYLETIDEHYVEGSTITQESVMLTEIDEKSIKKVERSDFG